MRYAALIRAAIQRAVARFDDGALLLRGLLRLLLIAICCYAAPLRKIDCCRYYAMLLLR